MSMAAKSMNMDFLCVLCASEASAFWIRDAVSFDGDRKFPPILREPISGFVAFRRITPFGRIWPDLYAVASLRRPVRCGFRGRAPAAPS